ncbi:MAG: glycosyltransferase, partial [Defluviitaleaceae bacterium]|nr:glycosyltransferase [Defluviitaleaceae bacterium]
MILSIGMIVKNEEKILRRCLEGLRPILENIRSELIIYDTGSDDATMDIAREFTPHVFEIEWRKDFAWARNHTVRRAKGQWYMYVDADEVFEDCSDLIEFFKSGEYRKFKSAGYRLRNHQADGSIGFFSPARLFKLDKNTKFVGKIHEGIAPNPPTKILESVADHYGYAFADADDIKQKHQRNIHALLEDFNEENPKSIRTVTHIIAEYTAMGDLDKIGEFLTIGRNLVGDNQNDMHYHIYASRWAEYLINTEKLAEAVDFIRQYFSDLKVVEQNVVALRNVEGVALQRLGRHKEAGDAFAQAIRLFEHNQRGEIRTGMTKLTSMQADMLEDKSKHLSGAVANYALAGEFEAAYTFAEEMQGKSIDIAYVYAANGVVNQLWDNFPKLYAYGLQCGAGSERYDNAVAAIERVVKSGAIREQMGLAFSKWADNEGSDDDYTRLWRLRLEDTNALGYFLSAEREFSQVYGDVLVAAIKQGRDFDGFLEKMKITDTAELAARIIRS